MKLILKAQSHPEIGDIPVEDSLFAIGRQEAPFNTHPNEAVAKLSRRHARIFEQDGHYFLVDSGSLNGTRLNGKALGQQAARLHQGDSINFAGQLEFRVELPPPQPSEPQPDIRLILTPCDPQAGLDRLVISRFPFLVSQNEGVFAGFPAALADEIRHLSRRHAHIFLKHGQPHIEDLGSTNGTFIGEQRLDEHAVPLQSGDRLTFGSPALSYRVELPAEEPPPAPRADPVTTVAPDEADPRTTFITSASPFLDIFCQQQEPPRQATTADPAAAEQPPSSARPGGRLARMRVFLVELRRALGFGEKPGSLKRRGIGAAIVLLLATVALLLYQRGAEERAIKALMAEAHYLEASQMAARILRQQPEETEIRTLATSALLQGTLPGWQQQLDAQAYENARQRLAALPLNDLHPQGRQLLALLGWVTDLEQWFAERPPDNHLELYRDEQPIRALLERWEDQGDDARRLLDLIRDQEPAFEARHSRIFSRLRQLENERSVYLTGIDTLNRRLENLLANNRSDELTALLDDFVRQYPTIRGTDRLRQDIGDYRTLHQAIGNRDLEALERLTLGLGFRTPPFQQASQELLPQQLPPPEIVERHRQARRAWLAGDAQQAIALLEPATVQPWGAALEPALQHYRQVESSYRQLQIRQNAADYGPALIAFYGSLDPVLDRHYLDALQAAFRQYTDEARRNADAAMAAAADYWQQYQQQGGIGSTLRLEDDISERFRQQALLLNLAQDEARQGLRLYGLLQQSPAQPSQALQQRIATEVQGQRQWLQDLSTVLDPPLLRAKLKLLNPAEEASP